MDLLKVSTLFIQLHHTHKGLRTLELLGFPSPNGVGQVEKSRILDFVRTVVAPHFSTFRNLKVSWIASMLRKRLKCRKPQAANNVCLLRVGKADPNF